MKIQEIAEKRRKERELSEALQEFAGYEVKKENRELKRALLVTGIIAVISTTVAILIKKK